MGRYVQVHRPDLGLKTPWPVARVTAYDETYALHTLSYTFDRLIEEVCFPAAVADLVRTTRSIAEEHSVICRG